MSGIQVLAGHRVVQPAQYLAYRGAVAPSRSLVLSGGRRADGAGAEGGALSIPQFPAAPDGLRAQREARCRLLLVPIPTGLALEGDVVAVGGWRVHRQGLQFALGLILGDFTMGSLWSIITLLFEVPTYRIYI